MNLNFFTESVSVIFCLSVLYLRNFHCQRTERFQEVTDPGRSQCSADPSFLTQRARSRIECARICLENQDGGCLGFNFKRDTLSCELFAWVRNYNREELPGCTLYQVSVKKTYII